jgi:hypothetical protein
MMMIRRGIRRRIGGGGVFGRKKVSYLTLGVPGDGKVCRRCR